MSTTQSTRIKRNKLNLSSPAVMGIINLTADSFYDGGKINSDKDLLKKVERMFNEGVDILDVGAYSSRPGAVDLPVAEEKKNAIAGVKAIMREFPNALLSIDTFRSEVATVCLAHGASIINDISGGCLDNKMFDLVVSAKVPYIMMHMQGNPRTMNKLTEYHSLISDIIEYFESKIADLRQRGVEGIILDPGFGFAKTKEQSFELLNNLERLKRLELPLLCGVSRKSMIFKTLNKSSEEALNGTTALNMACLMKGASLLRVHDVKEAKEAIELYNAMTMTSNK